MTEEQEQLRAKLLEQQAEELRRERDFRLRIRDSREAVRFHQRFNLSEEYEVDDDPG